MSDGAIPFRSPQIISPLLIGLAFAFFLAPDLLARPQTPNPHNLQDYTGTWALPLEGRNILVLRLSLSAGSLTGSLTASEHLQIDSDGSISHASGELREKPVMAAVVAGEILNIKVGSPGNSDDFVFRLIDHDHAQIQARLDSDLSAPWQLQRLGASQQAATAANSYTPPYSPEVVALQSELAEMVKRDQAVRVEVPILASKLKEVDQGNYPAVVRIHEKYGWPRSSVVGKEASQNYWVLVQHQELAFQEQILPDLRAAADAGEASKVDYAYLYDRVMVSEGKPQHWGTQGDCANGKPVLAPVDDPDGLLQRRKDLHIIPADEAEYLKSLDSQCTNFKEDTPATGAKHP